MASCRRWLGSAELREAKRDWGESERWRREGGKEEEARVRAKPRGLVGGSGAGGEGPRRAPCRAMLSARRCGNEGRRWGPLAVREREAGLGRLAAARARW